MWMKGKDMKRIFVFVLILIVICFCLVACKDDDDYAVRRGKDRIREVDSITPTEKEQVDNTGDKPTVPLMLEDVSNITDFYVTQNDIWEVVDAEEILARKLDEKTYETTIQVKLKNDVYKEAYRNISLVYDYYDIGGWILNSFTDISDVYRIEPQAGMPDEIGKRDVQKFYDGVFTLIGHDTNLKEETDIFIFSREVPGELFTQISEVRLEYRISDRGLWELYDTNEYNRKCQYAAEKDKWMISSLKGTTGYGGAKHCVKIKDFNENSVTLNIIDYERIWWISTGIYGQGYYNDDFYAHLEGKTLPADFQIYEISSDDEYSRTYFCVACYTLTGTVRYDSEIDGYRIDSLDGGFSESQLYLRPDGFYLTNYAPPGPRSLKSFIGYISNDKDLNETTKDRLIALSHEFE